MLTLASLQAFVSEWDQRDVDVDHVYGNQCADLANKYAIEVIGSPTFKGSGAVSFFYAPNFDANFYRAIVNTPEFVPDPGDVVIWEQNQRAGTGIYGHVAIYLNGDANSFRAFSQNWPEGSPCHSLTFLYDGVIGVLRPLHRDIELPKPPVVVPPNPEHDLTGPTAAVYIVAVWAPHSKGMYLRVDPKTVSPSGPWVDQGEKLYRAPNPKKGEPNWQTSWRYVRTLKGKEGWAFAPNLKAA